MPNPLGRRSTSPAVSATAEVEALKKELADLKAAYLQDMQNISGDMSQLNQKVETVINTPAEPTP